MANFNSVGWVVIFLLGTSVWADSSPSPTPSYRLDELDPSARVSVYTPRILKILEHWPPPTLSLKEPRPVIVRGIKTPGYTDYIGMIKHSEVGAPIEKVEELTDHFEDYPKIWEDVLSVKITHQDRNRLTTEWTRKAPTVFVSKVRFRMSYIKDKSVPGRIVYRQQLMSGNSLKYSDSLVVVEKISTDRTRISVVNFFDIELAGVFRAIAGGKIWKKSIENAFKDDIAFRARLDHPDWNVDKISEEADRVWDQNPIKEIEYIDLDLS